MLRASSSTSSTVRPTRSSSELLSRSSIRCFSGGRSVTTRCRNSAVSSSSRSGDSTPFTTMLRAMVCSCASSSADSSRPVNTTTGTSDSDVVALDLLQHLEAGHVGQPQVEHDAIASLLRAGSRAPRCRCRRCRSRCRRGSSSSRMLICSAGLSSTTSRRLRRGCAYSLIRASAASTPSVVVGLVTNENAPRASACWRSSSSVMICTGMWRVSGFCLSWLSTVQPSMSGRNTSSETAVGWNCLARSSASTPRIATSTLKPLSRARSMITRA